MTNTELREKLVELMKAQPCLNRDCYYCEENGAYCELYKMADFFIANGVTFAKDTDVPNKWISVKDRLPDEYVSVLGHMTDAEPFPEVRECCMIGGEFFFPALSEFHPVDKWTERP